MTVFEIQEKIAELKQTKASMGCQSAIESIEYIIKGYEKLLEGENS